MKYLEKIAELQQRTGYYSEALYFSFGMLRLEKGKKQSYFVLRVHSLFDGFLLCFIVLAILGNFIEMTRFCPRRNTFRRGL